MSKLTEFYQKTLDLCGLKVTSQGHLVFPSIEDGEEVLIPLTYHDKPVVFPDKMYLNDPNNKDIDIIVFHPLSESSLRAPSEVQELLRNAANIRFNTIGEALLVKAVELNHNATLDDGAKLNHKLSALFSSVPPVDDKFVTWFNKLIPTTQLFNISIRMHGKIDNCNVERVGVVSSPLYDDLVLFKSGDNPQEQILNSGRKKDITTLIAILESLFPGLEDNSYLAGPPPKSPAPTLMAFMNVVGILADRVNSILAIYGREAKDIIGGNTKSADFDRNIDLEQLRHSHPIEEYNIGVSNKDEPRSNERVKVDKPQTRRLSKEDLEPVRREEPVVEASSDVEENTVGFWKRGYDDDYDRPRRRSRDDYDDYDGEFYDPEKERRIERDRRNGYDDRDSYRSSRRRGSYDDRRDEQPRRRITRERRGDYWKEDFYDDRRDSYDDRYSRRRGSHDDRRDDRYDDGYDSYGGRAKETSYQRDTRRGQSTRGFWD